MTRDMLAAEKEWLPQFAGQALQDRPTIDIPAQVQPVEVPLDPALAIANRFQILAEQAVTEDTDS